MCSGGYRCAGAQGIPADGVPIRFELAKMAVEPELQGRGIGKHLLAHATAYAKERGADGVVNQ